MNLIDIKTILIFLQGKINEIITLSFFKNKKISEKYEMILNLLLTSTRCPRIVLIASKLTGTKKPTEQPCMTP